MASIISSVESGTPHHAFQHTHHQRRPPPYVTTGVEIMTAASEMDDLLAFLTDKRAEVSWGLTAHRTLPGARSRQLAPAYTLLLPPGSQALRGDTAPGRHVCDADPTPAGSTCMRPGRLQVQEAALDVLLGLTATPDGIETLKSKMDTVAAQLLRVVPGQHAPASQAALTALVNLAHDAAVVGVLLRLNVTGRIMDFIRESAVPGQGAPRLMAMLLCNVTADEGGCRQLLQLGQGKMEGLHM